MPMFQPLSGPDSGNRWHAGEYHFQALQRLHSERNRFVTTVFANAYATTAGEAGLPLYLQLQGQAALQRLGTQERLRLHTGNYPEQLTPLAQAYDPFDLISISNIAQWLSEAELHALVIQARDRLNAGGVLLARTATGRSTIVDVIHQHMQMNEALDAEVAQIERGPWFSVIAAGFR
jgi:S-adenosylmethionine:diacylglycerol 3-amino-3-carboxypropyl transferase